MFPNLARKTNANLSTFSSLYTHIAFLNMNPGTQVLLVVSAVVGAEVHYSICYSYCDPSGHVMSTKSRGVVQQTERMKTTAASDSRGATKSSQSAANYPASTTGSSSCPGVPCRAVPLVSFYFQTS